MTGRLAKLIPRRGFSVSEPVSGGESGTSLIETLAVVAILGMVGTVALCGLASLAKGSGIVLETASAVALAQRQLEFLKTLPYQAYPSHYSTIDVPEPYEIECRSIPLTDGNMQKVVVTVLKNGRSLLTVESIKVNR